MKSIVVLFLIVIFMVIGFLLNYRIQKAIRPRQSSGRLFLYFFSVMILVFVLSFLMVFMIAKLYPRELIK
jgi:hypothetical protein